jgi:hypothetical protein
MIGHQLAQDESDQTKHTENCEYSNALRGKSVLALAPIQHNLQRADAQRQKRRLPHLSRTLREMGLFAAASLIGF